MDTTIEGSARLSTTSMFLAPALLAALAARWMETTGTTVATLRPICTGVAGDILGGNGVGSIEEVQSHCSFSKGVLGHRALRLAGPLQAVLAVGVTWDIVAIVGLFILRKFHLSELLVGDDWLLSHFHRSISGRHGGNHFCVLGRHCEEKRTSRVE